MTGIASGKVSTISGMTESSALPASSTYLPVLPMGPSLQERRFISSIDGARKLQDEVFGVCYPRGNADFANHGDQNPNQDRDNADHHEELDKRKTGSACFGHTHLPVKASRRSEFGIRRSGKTLNPKA